LYGEQEEELKTCTSYLSAVPHDLALESGNSGLKVGSKES